MKKKKSKKWQYKELIHDFPPKVDLNEPRWGKVNVEQALPSSKDLKQHLLSFRILQTTNQLSHRIHPELNEYIWMIWYLIDIIDI